jgi:hypothetical protein
MTEARRCSTAQCPACGAKNLNTDWRVSNKLWQAWEELEEATHMLLVWLGVAHKGTEPTVPNKDEGDPPGWQYRELKGRCLAARRKLDAVRAMMGENK